MDATPFVDVLVCGGGPAGQLIALGLAQQGIDTAVLETRPLDEVETFGRATTLFPRSLELLETLDLTPEMTQAGFIGRAAVTFRDGKRVTARGWASMFPALYPSFHDYCLNIRQKMSQKIFAARYKADFGKDIHYSWEITQAKIDQSLDDGYNITATVSHPERGSHTVRCKYLVGSDGGSSTVRKLFSIEMEGEETTLRWIRMDGLMETDMPDANIGWATIETKTHGNGLWVKLDEDSYRIGFALTPALQAKYPNGPSQADAVAEAVECMKPFKLSIERLDWWTCYSIKQKVAASLHKDQYVFLAGDAAHTHSSGFAQGMNTAIHDVTNLVWKLAGTLKGWYQPQVLNTYHDERHAAAKKLIGIDQQAAAAISGKIPPGLLAAGGDADDAVLAVFQANLGFTVGLGVEYGVSAVSQAPLVGSTVPGSRSPDALLHVPGPAVPTRLHTAMQRRGPGRWNILVLAGYPTLTAAKIKSLGRSISAAGSAFDQWSSRLTLSTIMIGTACSAWEAFGGPAVGNLYFDQAGQAHTRYGISATDGAIVVVRPDGVLGFAAGLDQLAEVEKYFKSIFA